MTVPPDNATVITDYFLKKSRKRKMEDDLWVECSDDEVFMEEATLSFLLSTSKVMALDRDPVEDEQSTPGRDCLSGIEYVPESKDDLGGEQWSKDDRGSSWTDEDSFERLVDEYEEDSTPRKWRDCQVHLAS